MASRVTLNIRLPRAREGKRMSYDELWKKGMEISGGFGFWGHEVAQGPDAKKAVKAWVDGLRKLGFSDREIIAYGDSRDGRHIGDAMYGQSPAGMKAAVVRNAKKFPGMVEYYEGRV
jgi:hypothetical protein